MPVRHEDVGQLVLFIAGDIVVVKQEIALRHLRRTAHDSKVNVMSVVRSVADIEALEEQRLTFKARGYGLLDIRDRVSD